MRQNEWNDRLLNVGDEVRIRYSKAGCWGPFNCWIVKFSGGDCLVRFSDNSEGWWKESSLELVQDPFDKWVSDVRKEEECQNSPFVWRVVTVPIRARSVAVGI